jgi:NAD(P)-dependent dehydrogenase (short-subunit alcohol dehydrogenase family)
VASERWQRVLDVNLRGVILGTYLAVPAMQRRGGGAIVHTASGAGLTPFENDAVYAASKAGVVNFTRSLVFLQQEANIRVNCVCPGLVETNISVHAMGLERPEEREEYRRRRYGDAERLQPEDIARAVLQLIADDTLNGKSYRVYPGQPWELL